MYFLGNDYKVRYRRYLMRKLRIGIDIDGTLTCPTAFVSFVNQSFQSCITLDDLRECSIKKLLNISPQVFNKWLKENESIVYGGLPLAKDAKNILMQWHMQHELYYITARKESLKAATLKLFDQNEIPFDFIDFVGTHNKIESVKKYKIHLLIEDNYNNACLISRECSIPVLLMDVPYNRKSEQQNVFRISGWLGANEWISKNM